MDFMITQDVLTLKELADYLRIPGEEIEQHAAEGKIPGRKIGENWRFLKSAIDEWLKNYDGRTILLRQAGGFADDEMLNELVSNIYAERGRPEAEKIF